MCDYGLDICIFPTQKQGQRHEPNERSNTKTRTRVKLNTADFESLGQKLERLHSSLSTPERQVFEFLLESAADAAGQSPPPPWMKSRFRFKPRHPRGAKMLVAGGSDGLTILITRSGKIVVVPPEGPLPTDRDADVLGAIPING